MSPVVPRQSNICTLGPIDSAGRVYTFVPRELCAAYAVCAVVIEPDITAAIARTMPILRIRFLPVCREFCDGNGTPRTPRLRHLRMPTVASLPSASFVAAATRNSPQQTTQKSHDGPMNDVVHGHCDSRFS